MGVRQLETYMRSFVRGGVVEVDLIQELINFKKLHKELSILVFDFENFMCSFYKGSKEILCGGRLNKVKPDFEAFLKRLSPHAKLVFIKDGLVVDQKLSSWIKHHSERYDTSVKITEKIRNGSSLQDIVDAPSLIGNIPRMAFAYKKTMVDLAKKYGELIVTYTRECDSEIARYAYNNPKVIAIMSDDTDFLIFPGHWRYFSCKNLSLETLKTVELSRKALRDQLELDDTQMAILSTLSGNDIVLYDKLRKNFHTHLDEKWWATKNPGFRFGVLAGMAQKLTAMPKAHMIEKIHEILGFGDISIVEESLEMYNPIFSINEPADDLHKFCLENHIQSVVDFLASASIDFDLAFIDVSSFNTELIIEILKRQMGVVFANMPEKREQKYEIVTKHEALHDYRSEFVKPTVLEDVPPLLELLDRSNFPEHDGTRFKLLKYMIDIKGLKHHDLKTFPTNYLQDVLTLVFMCHHKIIEPFEADLIMLTLKHVEEGTVPDDLKVPEKLNVEAFHVSFLFNKLHKFIDECFQIAGLNEFTKLPNFDGVLFHNLYLEYIDRPYEVHRKLDYKLRIYAETKRIIISKPSAVLNLPSFMKF